MNRPTPNLERRADEAQPEPSEVTRWPRWFLVLPLLAIAAWVPIEPYFAADDYIAMNYAADFDHVLADFVGPQYATTDLWLFYRPMITLSFWLDQTLGGAAPGIGHWSNAVAHGVSALLIGLIWRRFLGDGLAFGAALLWAILPSHIGSIAWVVGRVDSHTTVWCMLAILLCLRAQERRGSTWPAVLACAAALASKEIAFVVPPIATWLCTIRGSGSGGGGGGVASRLRRGLAWTWPLWLLFACYLTLRFFALGRLGGYAASNYALGPMLVGLGTILLDLGAPLRWIGTPPDGVVPAWLWSAAAATPVGVALLVVAVRRPGLLLAGAVAFAIAVVPISAFLSASGNPHALRYLYLPTAVLVGLVAAAGRWAVVFALLAWMWPLVAVRHAQLTADRETAAMHAALLREAELGPAEPMFVAGMPHANAQSTAMQIHFGVDRMLQPPFLPAGVRLYGWRPFGPTPGVIRLVEPGEPPFALPGGSTWWFTDEAALGHAPPPPPLPELAVRGDEDGVFDLSTARLTTLIDGKANAIATDAPTFGLTTSGVSPIAYRVTIFTATGYLSCVCWNHAPNDAGTGQIDMLRFFGGDPTHPIDTRPARLSTQIDSFIGDALVIPTTLDMVPEFPTLIEAGDVDLAARRFVPTHRARRLITFAFDREYPDWVRRAQGL